MDNGQDLNNSKADDTRQNTDSLRTATSDKSLRTRVIECTSVGFMLLKQPPRARNQLKRIAAKMEWTIEYGDDLERCWILSYLHHLVKDTAVSASSVKDIVMSAPFKENVISESLQDDAASSPFKHTLLSLQIRQ
ncbi:hypothetical protein BSLG_006056 [Batrachochytrium salamandrivorans]|nr:hypothetical protein BSLG_006056 [Batrachochytrium salamandrivorans]